MKRAFHFVIPATRTRSTTSRKPRRFRRTRAVDSGSHLAIACSMRNNTDLHRPAEIVSFSQGVRAFAEASLLALAFGLAIFLVGLPVALSVRLAYEGLSWLARIGEEMSPLTEMLL